MVRVGLALLLAGGAAITAIGQPASDKLTAEEIVKKSRDAYAALSSYSDSGTVKSEMAGLTNTLTFHIRLQRPDRYRIDWKQGTDTKDPGLSVLAQAGVVWSDGSGHYCQITGASQGKETTPRKLPNLQKALAYATGQSWTAASTVPGAFFGQDCGDVFAAPVLAGRYSAQRQADGLVGDVDCYVVSSTTDLSKVAGSPKPGTATITLWIGKKDFLVHQCRTRYVEKVDSSGPPTDQAIDDASRKSLEMQKKPVTPEAIAAMRPQMRAIMKQVQSTLKSGFESGVVHTQLHEKISVNQKFSTADFAK